MQVQAAIQQRLSIRRYATTKIPETDLTLLLQALRLAPSANNAQNWEFVFVQNSDLKQRLITACANQPFIGQCAFFVAGVADPALKWHMVDITIAMTQFALQAVELGYGTCWIGAFDENRVKDILEVPADKKVVICMTLGQPKGRHVPRGRKPLAQTVHLNRFGQMFETADDLSQR